MTFNAVLELVVVSGNEVNIPQDCVVVIDCGAGFPQVVRGGCV